MHPNPATSTASGDHALSSELATAGHTRLRTLIDSLLAAPRLLDRALLSELATFLDHDAWVAVDAADQLANTSAPAPTAPSMAGPHAARSAA